MRKGGGSSKGSSFEREICKQLSLWWSEGNRDDIFWRTAGSGGRATNRARQGKETSGAYGDLTFIDPSGADLLKVCCFELKRGYGQWCVLDLIDRRTDAKPCIAAKFWKQAKRSAEDAHVPHSIVIFRRDQKVPAVMIGKRLLSALFPFVGTYRGPKLSATIENEQIFITTLADLLNFVTPESIRQLLECGL